MNGDSSRGHEQRLLGVLKIAGERPPVVNFFVHARLEPRRRDAPARRAPA